MIQRAATIAELHLYLILSSRLRKLWVGNKLVIFLNCHFFFFVELYVCNMQLTMDLDVIAVRNFLLAQSQCLCLSHCTPITNSLQRNRVDCRNRQVMENSPCGQDRIGILILPLLLSSCVTIGVLFTLLEPQFPHF